MEKMLFSNTQSLLEKFGWNERLDLFFLPFREQGLEPARIIRDGRELYRGITGAGEIGLSLSGSYRYLMELGTGVLPVAGDWCAVRLAPDGSMGLLEAVLPRRTVLHRRGFDFSQPESGTEEVGAANIDTAAIVSGISEDFNPRRIERFLINIRSGGAEPALILTKADLVADGDDYLRQARDRFGDVPVFLVDSLSGRGREDLSGLFLPGKTAALIGISGAGKTTLINMLLGGGPGNAGGALKTGAVRENDGRGRHTTTCRGLFLLPNGALVLDTPGVRAVGISADAGTAEAAFEEIASLAAGCRFTDCGHRDEPGCAVVAAVESGSVDRDRYANFLNLMAESRPKSEVLRMRKEREKKIGKIVHGMYKEGLFKRRHLGPP
jgi:ribosome biogenesis GTPase